MNIFRNSLRAYNLIPKKRIPPAVFFTTLNKPKCNGNINGNINGNFNRNLSVILDKSSYKHITNTHNCRFFSSYTKNDILYTDTHETIIFLSDDIIRIGLSHYAKKLLGEIVFIEAEDIGNTFDVEDNIIVIESVKAVGDINTLYEGEIIAHNEELLENVETINELSEDDAWIVDFKITKKNNDAQLMNYYEYKIFTDGIEES